MELFLIYTGDREETQAVYAWRPTNDKISHSATEGYGEDLKFESLSSSILSPRIHAAERKGVTGNCMCEPRPSTN